MNKGKFHTRMYDLLGKIFSPHDNGRDGKHLFFIIGVTPVTNETHVFYVKLLCKDGTTIEITSGEDWLNRITPLLW